jgi:hypothetical protein
MVFVHRILCALVLAACADQGSAALPDGGGGDMAKDGCAVAAPAASDVCLRRVEGRVVDEAGAPLGEALVTVCGDLCFYGRSGTDGRFTVPVNTWAALERYALHVHGRPHRADYYVRLPAVVDGTALLGELRSPLLPSSGPAVPMDQKASTITSGEITLAFPDGVEVELDVEDVIELPKGGELRAVRVADPRALPFVDAAAPPELLFGLAPFEAIFSRKVPLRLQNVLSWPAGAKVEITQQGAYVLGEAAPGPLVSAAAAEVSSDGLTIATLPGEGLRRLSFLAARRVP